jgi:hypothetical protein
MNTEIVTATDRAVTVLKDRHTSHVEVQEPTRLHVVEGTAYVTLEGDFRDYIVRSGETIALDHSGLAVIQGFPNAAYKVCA